jgi:hypothetical protein
MTLQTRSPHLRHSNVDTLYVHLRRPGTRGGASRRHTGGGRRGGRRVWGRFRRGAGGGVGDGGGGGGTGAGLGRDR